MAGRYDLGTARGTIEIDASSIGRATAALKTAGLGLIAVGGAALAGFGLAVKSAADFESKMSAVEAVLGKGVGPAMDQIRQKALDLGSKTVFGAQNVASAMEDLAKAGLNAQEIIGGAADATVQLAAASGETISLARAAEIAANAMRTFNLTADDMVHVADEIAGAANASTLEVDDVATSLKYVGPVAHAAGLSLDEVATTLAVLGDRGIRGSTAGTSLRGVLLSLQPSSKKAEDAMKDLGLITEDGSNKFFDAAGNMKSMAEITGILHDAFSGLSEEEKVAAANAIFQRRAMASALVLAEAGTEGFNQYAESIDRTSAAEVASKRLDNLSGDIKLLRAAVETTLIRAGTPFQAMLRGWVQSLTKLIRTFGELSPETQTLLLKILAVTGAVLTAAGAFLLAASVFLRVFKVIVDLREAWAIISVIIKAFGAAVAGTIGVVGIVIVIIIALIAILVLLYFKVQAVRDFIDKAFDVIAEAVISAWNAIYPALLGFARFIRDEVIPAILDLWNKSQDVWDTITGAIVGMWHAVYPVLREFYGWLQENLFPVFVEFGRLVAAVAGRVRQVFGGLVKFVGDLIKIFRTEFNFVVDLFQVVLPKALQFLQAVWTTVFPFLMATLNTFRALFENAFNIMSTIISAVFIPALNILVAVFQYAWDLIVNSIEAALQIIKGVFEVLRGIITLDWETLWQGIQDILGGALKWALGFLTLTWELFKTVFHNGIDAVIELMKNLPGAILRALGNLLGVLLQSGKDVLQGLWNGIIEISLLLLAWFLNLPSEILKKIIKADKWLFDIGKEVIQGLWDGMIELWKKVGNWLKDRADDVAGFFKTALNVGSPSKVMRDIGQYTMQGLLQGLELLRPALESTVEELANTLTSLSAAPDLNAAFNTTSALSGLAAVPTQAPQQIITYEGDDVDVNVRTDADPHEIVDTLMFEKRFR